MFNPAIKPQLKLTLTHVGIGQVAIGFLERYWIDVMSCTVTTSGYT